MPMLTPEVGMKPLLQVSADVPEWESKHIPDSAPKSRRGSRSQSEIARAAGISQGFLSELECGHKRPTSGVAQKLASALGMPRGQAPRLQALRRPLRD
jgi:DNA-binding XRE family transcriptional regulator